MNRSAKKPSSGQNSVSTYYVMSEEKELNANFLEQELRDTTSQKVEVIADAVLLSDWYIHVGMYEKAISAYQRALELEPNVARIHHNLGFAYYKAGDFDEAQRELETAITLNPQNANFHYTLGLLRHDCRFFAEAIESFSQAIALNPKYIEALYERGILYDKSERYAEAQKDFETILSLQSVSRDRGTPKESHPDFFRDARHNLGIIYIKLKQWREAEEIFLQCLEYDHKDADAFYHLGGIYLISTGDTTRAMDSFENSVYLAPTHLDARYGLAQLYAKRRHAHSEYRRTAIDQLLEVIRIDEELHTFGRIDEVFFLLGSLYDDEPDDADLAIQAYRTGLEYTESPVARNNLGVLYSRKGMFEHALREFRQSIQLNPEYEHPYHNLAKIYFYQRDEDIRKDFHTWIEHSPEDAARVLHNSTLALVDVARSEAYQSVYSRLHKIKNLIGVSGAKLRRIIRNCYSHQELTAPLTEILDEQEQYYTEMVALLKALKQEELVFNSLDINKTLSVVVEHISPSLAARNISCQMLLDEELPQVKGDSEQLKDAFHNIILNAAEAMADGGSLRVQTEYDDVNAEVTVTFTDTGHGIPNGEQNNVFKPGYTLKEQGSGFGLSIVYRVVREHRGRITLTSAEGMGTTITIYLPADFEASPIHTNLQMRPIFYEAPNDLIVDELA